MTTPSVVEMTYLGKSSEEEEGGREEKAMPRESVGGDCFGSASDSACGAGPGAPSRSVQVPPCVLNAAEAAAPGVEPTGGAARAGRSPGEASLPAEACAGPAPELGPRYPDATTEDLVVAKASVPPQRSAAGMAAEAGAPGGPSRAASGALALSAGTVACWEGLKISGRVAVGCAFAAMTLGEVLLSALMEAVRGEEPLEVTLARGTLSKSSLPAIPEEEEEGTYASESELRGPGCS